MAYDEKCEDLARHFLEGVTGSEPIDPSAKDLAQWIQDAVENWFAGHECGEPKPKPPDMFTPIGFGR